MRMAYLKRRRVPLAVIEWHPSMKFALIIIDSVFLAYTNRDALMTAAQEDAHSEDSLHFGIVSNNPDATDPRCRAADFSAADIEEIQAAAMERELQAGLGKHFDVVFEYTTVDKETGPRPQTLHHLHIEFDPETILCGSKL